MASTFFGIEIGKRGLATAQQALNITSHNMVNAGTKGYTRQVPIITASSPFPYPSFNGEASAGQVGTGVEVVSINRIRDQLLDGQIYKETSTLNYWSSQSNMLDQIERTMNEPSDTGLAATMSDFWTALQDLQNTAGDVPSRNTVIQKALTLTDYFRQTYSDLKDLRSNADSQIKDSVKTINEFAKQLADLNDQIGKVTIQGDQPNDLLDQRDMVLEQLSQFADIRVSYDQQDRVTVMLGGGTLVNNVHYNELTTVTNPSDPAVSSVVWAGGENSATNQVSISSGSIKSLLDIRDTTLPNLMQSLDALANTLRDVMNQQHKKGYDLDGNPGVDFFTGTGAADIGVNVDIQNDSRKIAASATGASDNGDNMKAMAGLFQTKLQFHAGTTTTTATMIEFYTGLITTLGIQSQNSQSRVTNQDLLVANLTGKRASISGVSMDEETSNMLIFNHAFDAASKVITTMDELLDVIINHLQA